MTLPEGCAALALLVCTACTSSSSKTKAGTGGASGSAGAAGAATGGTGGIGGAAGAGGTPTGGSAGVGGSGGVPSTGGSAGNVGTPQAVGAIDVNVVRGFAVTAAYAFVSGEHGSGTSSGLLNRIDVSTGTKDSWNESAAELWGIAADESVVLAVNYAGPSLVSVGTNGGFPPSSDAITPQKPYLAALDSGHIYFDDESSATSQVWRRKRGTTDPAEVIATGLPTSWTMKLQGGELFLTGYDAPTLHKIPKTPTSTSPTPLATLPHGSGAKGLAVNATTAYVATRDDTCKNGVGGHESEIHKVERVGGNAVSLLPKSGIGITALALHGTDLYFSVVGECGKESTGKIMRIATAAAGTPVEVATSQAAPVELAVHGDTLYWVNQGTSTGVGKVMQLKLK